jgi:putative FmdB family regulatory protein
LDNIVQEGCLPLYEYRCVKCGALTEKIQKFSDPPLMTCEKCGGRVERLVSSPAIQFKGTGWYVTDYARKSSSLPSQSAEKSDGGDKSPKTSTESSKKSDVSKGK